VFIVGCERSGTTLLQRMLDSHPELAVAYETHFLAKVVRGLRGASDAPLDDEVVSRIRDHRYFGRLGLAEGVVDASLQDATSVASFVALLYSHFADSQGKRFAGEKSPHYVKVLSELHALFPSAKCIHIVRDGRDVALSMLEWEGSKVKRPGKGPWALSLWEEEAVAVCALWWAVYLRNADRGRAALGAHYREVRYEKFVAEPAETLAQLCSFLEIPDAPEMSEFHVGRTRADPTLSSKERWLPPTRGLRDWRTRMAPEDLQLFEVLVGGVLRARGYELGAQKIDASIRSRADRCLDWWRTNIEHDDMQLPDL
jgi:hypothetical protein